MKIFDAISYLPPQNLNGTVSLARQHHHVEKKIDLFFCFFVFSPFCCFDFSQRPCLLKKYCKNRTKNKGGRATWHGTKIAQPENEGTKASQQKMRRFVLSARGRSVRNSGDRRDLQTNPLNFDILHQWNLCKPTMKSILQPHLPPNSSVWLVASGSPDVCLCSSFVRSPSYCCWRRCPQAADLSYMH